MDVAFTGGRRPEAGLRHDSAKCLLLLVWGGRPGEGGHESGWKIYHIGATGPICCYEAIVVLWMDEILHFETMVEPLLVGYLQVNHQKPGFRTVVRLMDFVYQKNRPWNQPRLRPLRTVSGRVMYVAPDAGHPAPAPLVSSGSPPSLPIRQVGFAGDGAQRQEDTTDSEDRL